MAALDYSSGSDQPPLHPEPLPREMPVAEEDHDGLPFVK